MAEAFDAGITPLDAESEEASGEASIEDRGEEDKRYDDRSRGSGEPEIFHSSYGSRKDVARSDLEGRRTGEATDTAEEASGIEIAGCRQRHYG